VLCLVVDGKVQGCAIVAYRKGSRAAHLYTIAVLPKLQGYGFGLRLLRAAERAARRRGCNALRLEVRTRNRAARALYARANYREIERVAPYYADGAPALRLERIFTEPARTRIPRRPPLPRSAASRARMR
jgi:ribosomal protein S18 acetylase RimI-like enzyme